jgi:hypothetical protein
MPRSLATRKDIQLSNYKGAQANARTNGESHGMGIPETMDTE